MKKIIVATALILCLILAIAACKKDETNGDTPTETTVTTEAPDTGTEPGGKKPEETTAGDEKTKEMLAGGMEIADKDEAKYGQAQYPDGK